MPAYHFRVEWGGANIGFMEVTGLNINVDVTEYRSGSDPVQTLRKMPGLIHYSNIVLKRGIAKGDDDFIKWIKTIQLNTVERRDVVISLLNENHDPVMVWRAHNAFPVKYSGPDLVADSSDVAIESLELAHEGLTVETT